MLADVVQAVDGVGQVSLDDGHGHAIDHTAGFVLRPDRTAALLEQARAFSR